MVITCVWLLVGVMNCICFNNKKFIFIKTITDIPNNRTEKLNKEGMSHLISEL